MDYIQSIRQLAKNTELLCKGHAFGRMMTRGISKDDALNILRSDTNEVIEIQKPDKKSKDERILVYDREYCKDIILVIVMTNFPRIEIITAEYVDYDKWEKDINNNLRRKIK